MRDLEAVCARINRTLNGKECQPWYRDDSGKLRATIGAFYIDGAYGGYALYRMVNPGGGVSDVFRVGHVPKRELRNLMFAYLEGIDAASTPHPLAVCLFSDQVNA